MPIPRGEPETFPMCVPDDFPLMNEDQLIRYVRAHCGDDVADYVARRIARTDFVEAARRAHIHMKEALDAISSADDAVREAAQEFEGVQIL